MHLFTKQPNNQYIQLSLTSETRSVFLNLCIKQCSMVEICLIGYYGIKRNFIEAHVPLKAVWTHTLERNLESACLNVSQETNPKPQCPPKVNPCLAIHQSIEWLHKCESQNWLPFHPIEMYVLKAASLKFEDILIN